MAIPCGLAKPVAIVSSPVKSVSHRSPTPSASASAWATFGTVGQLSTSSVMVSPSKSPNPPIVRITDAENPVGCATSTAFTPSTETSIRFTPSARLTGSNERVNGKVSGPVQPSGSPEEAGRDAAPVFPCARVNGKSPNGMRLPNPSSVKTGKPVLSNLTSTIPAGPSRKTSIRKLKSSCRNMPVSNTISISKSTVIAA